MDYNELFEYREGSLYNKVRRGARAIIGQKVGTKHHTGYIAIIHKGKFKLGHRVIWEMLKGDIPDGLEIDHINRIRDDNRIENLRLVTRLENMHNKG